MSLPLIRAINKNGKDVIVRKIRQKKELEMNKNNLKSTASDRKNSIDEKDGDNKKENDLHFSHNQYQDHSEAKESENNYTDAKL